MKEIEVAGIGLSEGEEIKIRVERHPFGLMSIIAGIIVAMVAIVVLWIILLAPGFSSTIFEFGLTSPFVSFVAVLLLALTLAIGWIGIKIYRNNIFVVTDRKVIQQTCVGLFNKTVQTIDLPAVEDVSFQKQGILQNVLDYGSLRLSTVGDETTYQFSFVLDPEKQVRIISGIVHAAKEKSNSKK